MAANLSGVLAMPREAKPPMHQAPLPFSIVTSHSKLLILSAERSMSCLYAA